MVMTAEEATAGATNAESPILKILMSFGPIMSYQLKLEAAQKIVALQTPEPPTELRDAVRQLVEDFSLHKVCLIEPPTNRQYHFDVDELIDRISTFIAARESNLNTLLRELSDTEDRCRDLLVAYDKSSPEEVVPLDEVVKAGLNARDERAAGIASGHSATDCDGPDCGNVIARAILSKENDTGNPIDET